MVELLSVWILDVVHLLKSKQMITFIMKIGLLFKLMLYILLLLQNWFEKFGFLILINRSITSKNKVIRNPYNAHS